MKIENKMSDVIICLLSCVNLFILLDFPIDFEV